MKNQDSDQISKLETGTAMGKNTRRTAKETKDRQRTHATSQDLSVSPVQIDIVRCEFREDIKSAFDRCGRRVIVCRDRRGKRPTLVGRQKQSGRWSSSSQGKNRRRRDSPRKKKWRRRIRMRNGERQSLQLKRRSFVGHCWGQMIAESLGNEANKKGNKQQRKKPNRKMRTTPEGQEMRMEGKEESKHKTQMETKWKKKGKRKKEVTLNSRKLEIERRSKRKRKRIQKLFSSKSARDNIWREGLERSFAFLLFLSSFGICSMYAYRNHGTNRSQSPRKDRDAEAEALKQLGMNHEDLLILLLPSPRSSSSYSFEEKRYSGRKNFQRWSRWTWWTRESRIWRSWTRARKRSWKSALYSCFLFWYQQTTPHRISNWTSRRNSFCKSQSLHFHSSSSSECLRQCCFSLCFLLPSWVSRQQHLWWWSFGPSVSSCLQSFSGDWAWRQFCQCSSGNASCFHWYYLKHG